MIKNKDLNTHRDITIQMHITLTIARVKTRKPKYTKIQENAGKYKKMHESTRKYRKIHENTKKIT